MIVRISSYIIAKFSEKMKVTTGEFLGTKFVKNFKITCRKKSDGYAVYFYSFQNNFPKTSTKKSLKELPSQFAEE